MNQQCLILPACKWLVLDSGPQWNLQRLSAHLCDILTNTCDQNVHVVIWPKGSLSLYWQALVCYCILKHSFSRYKPLLVISGFLISFGIRCNIGVAIVKMTDNSTGVRRLGKFLLFHNYEILSLQQAEFDWDKGTIGIVDSSYFVGYFITQVPGGFLAAKYRANL